ATIVHPDAARVIPPTGTLHAFRISESAAEAYTAARIRGTVLASITAGLERLAADSRRQFGSAAIRQPQCLAFVDEGRVGAAVQRILHGEYLGLPGSRIATHGDGIYLQVQLVILNLRVQPRGNVQGAISRPISGPIDVQTALAGSAVRQAQCVAIIDDGLVG